MRIEKSILVIVLFVLCAIEASALPFNDDMVNSQLRTGSIMRPAIKGTVPVGGKKGIVETKEEAEALTNPKKPTKKSLTAGERLFAVNCTACHGKLAPDPKKYVPGKVVMGAPNLADKTYHTRTDGQIFRAIYFGNLIMPAVGWKISHDEAWDIVNYVRSIQEASKVLIQEGE